MTTQPISILPGAAISAERGVPIFQGTDWRGHSHYELADIEAWHRNPALVWGYYSDRRVRARDTQPNPTHHALAKFGQKRGPAHFFRCTQNVSGLHEPCGSKNVAHQHAR